MPPAGVASAVAAMIEVRGLRVRVSPATVAVDGVDLTVAPGEFVVVIGSSGAGKTTLLRALNRLVEPTEGTVRVAGRPVTGAGPAELREVRRRIGTIFQQFNLVRRASVIANVLAGRLGYVPALGSLLGRFPASDHALAEACLARVGLAAYAQRRADTLSGGEQQRVAIARALAQTPDVILGDEPTASLDPQLTVAIMDILAAINREQHLTLVVSQHQLDTALAYGTRIVGLRAGRVVFDGPPWDVTPGVVRAVYDDVQAVDHGQGTA
jgi:phosphonate transport system ATP-binding protein